MAKQKVKGYKRTDGTKVKGHTRTKSRSLISHNKGERARLKGRYRKAKRETGAKSPETNRAKFQLKRIGRVIGQIRKMRSDGRKYKTVLRRRRSKK